MIKIHLWVRVERWFVDSLIWLLGGWSSVGISLARVCYSFVGRHVIHSITVNYLCFISMKGTFVAG